MSAIEFLGAQAWVERLGLTLLHFLWQGVVIAALYAAARQWMGRGASANARYLLSCAALAVMVAAPVVTWVALAPANVVGSAMHLTAHVPTVVGEAASETPVSAVYTRESDSTWQMLPWVVAIWFAGATAFWMRLMGGWLVAVRLRRTMVRLAPVEWQNTLDRLKERLRVSRPVQLLVSTVVQAPSVVGWLKPVVLVPLGALSGLPGDQIEALLLHELAHIQRHDYLVNILQSAIEAMLFYHPAVWWVSGHIRAEREMCCDDVAVLVSGDAFTYASALAELESARPIRAHTAMAANGGRLADRIARLLGQSRPVSRVVSGPGVLVSTLLLAATTYSMFGQSAATPRFDVTSVKPHGNGSVVGLLVNTLPGGRLHSDFAPVRLLIQFAYGVKAFQILGGPDWMNSEGYDVDAKAEGNPEERQMRLMMQGLLEDRFKLQLHRETKDLPGFTLVATKKVKLQAPKEATCPTSDPAQPEPPARALGQAQKIPCGTPVMMLNRPGPRILGANVSMSDLAKILTGAVGRTVIDKTAYSGKFDVHLEFAFDDALEGVLSPTLPQFRRQEPRPGDLESPTLFTALQEQLGLKLEPAKVPTEVIVVDHLERPTGN